ncbi:MAG: hypothetical protein JGK17_08255 [Microcoleus sp. PH2017_10_PVI_O_A]|uniref:hypothetical protein n=1 Tax=unclassified Microcoleus TaxID=2642155 RepID=UPI001E0D82B8|nr:MULTISPECIES: hypothetical protein [unclassified Microcoleus]TAE84105.1 MAG: hypothetical protein EAZ83_07705 [Oscillatoriales cyanobacterium]MCC3405571.1 hypothetical protein [Microcoleus sp. PH2017_10_PVI_O_A]MCC3459661.1 hypothetical protein [Microcoleus sp. PH2017_11_PCY_U_A]MCC3478036.1 hypothetical protein [Microcoleus sp. PH2017_12_PCY_D_A]MCC3559015.1 hypothetical protein [Microcoleus sp. PH2017_27_LUM_O_A]
MTGEQNNECINIDRTTTFEEALESALDVVGSIIGWNENNHLISILHEVKYIDREFKKKVINECTLTAFYNAVLLLHSNLILFSDFNNKDSTFTQKASTIHLKIIDKIKILETQASKQGYFLEDRRKYLKIWKELLKDIIDLCFKSSTNHKDLSNNVAKNKNLFTILGSIFSNFSTIMLKRRSWPNVSIKRSQNSAIEDETSNQSQSPASENSENLSGGSKVYGKNLHVAIAILTVVVGLILALTLFR